MLSLLVFAFTLIVLPLVSIRVAALLLVLSYLPLIKGIKGISFSRRSLIFSTLASIALITASLTAQNLPTPLALLQWLILIWSAPLFGALINKYGRQKVATVVLTIIVIHAVWGIGQFILQRDLDLTRLGESKINIYEPAVAKIQINFPPFKLLRAYGPYKHANSFAGVLVLGLALLSLHRERNEVRVAKQTPSSLPSPYPGRRDWRIFIFFLLTLALATTFSRAAIFSFLLVIIFNAKIFFKLKYFLLLAVIVLTFFPVMFYRFSFTGSNDKAIPERINSVQWASEIITENNFWQGTGIGHYPSALKNYLDSHSATYQPWQIDFVHSVPILLVAEWGIVATLILILALYFILDTKYLILLCLAPILLTDHYFVTQLSPAVFLLLALSLHRLEAPPTALPDGNAVPAPE